MTHFTEEDDAFIRKNWDSMTGEEIAKALGRNHRASISCRAAIIGLRPRGRRKQKWFLAPEREGVSLPLPQSSAIRTDFIKPPSLEQLMAGSANCRPRQHKVEA